MTVATPVVGRSTRTCLEPRYPPPTTPTRIPSARARTSHPRLPRSRDLDPFEAFPRYRKPRLLPGGTAPPHERAELRQIRVWRPVLYGMRRSPVIMLLCRAGRS